VINQTIIYLKLFTHLLLPQEFSYNEAEKKIVYLANANQNISDKNCSDTGMMRFTLNSGKNENYILSFCHEEKSWYFFNTAEVTPPEKKKDLLNMSKMLNERKASMNIYKLPASGLGILLQNNSSESENEFKMFYPEGKIFMTQTYRENNKNLLFIFMGNWYFLESAGIMQKANFYKANLFKLKDMPSYEPMNKIKTRELWFSLIKSFELLNNYNTLFIQFESGSSLKPALYNLNSKTWELSPPFILTSEEWNQVSNNNINVVFRLTLPESENIKRQYFEIFVDEENAIKTDYHIEGKNIYIPLNLTEGNHVIKTVRYIADEIEENYVRAKNIQQIPVFSIDIENKRVYLISIREGESDEEKPLYVETFKLSYK